MLFQRIALEQCLRKYGTRKLRQACLLLIGDEPDPKVPSQSYDYCFDMLEETVLPNVNRLQELFRKHNLEVIHVRIQ